MGRILIEAAAIKTGESMEYSPLKAGRPEERVNIFTEVFTVRGRYRGIINICPGTIN